MLKGAPGMGEKTLQKVTDYLMQNNESTTQFSLDFGTEAGEIHGKQRAWCDIQLTKKPTEI